MRTIASTLAAVFLSTSLNLAGDIRARAEVQNNERQFPTAPRPGTPGSLEDPAAVVRTQQTESARLAERWLQSSDPRFRAWGASLVLRDSHRQLLPRLAALAAEHRAAAGPLTDTQHDEHHAMLAVLDAIIQLELTPDMTPEAIARLYPEFPTQALILLARPGMARPPATDTLLMDILRSEHGATGAWLTAANVLIANGVKGVAAAILDDVSIDLSVRVVDDGATAPPVAGRGYSCPFGGAGPRRDGWPDVGNYYITTNGGETGLAESSGGPVSRGPDPTFYTRIVSGPDPVVPRADLPCDDLVSWPARGGRDRLTERLLASLAHESIGAPSVTLHPTRTIVWRDNEQYQRALWDLIGEQRVSLNALLDTLVQSGAMTLDERRGRWPTIAVRVADARAAREPLPPLFNVGPGVTLVTEP